MKDELIELKILDYTILLPIPSEGTNIKEITNAGMEEFRKFYHKKTPFKVLYTMDERKRILADSLVLPSIHVGNILTIIIEEYSTTRNIQSFEISRYYREYQLFILNQIKEYTNSIIQREEVSTMDKEIFLLLNEISIADNIDIEIASLTIYRLLMIKLNDKNIILSAAKEISRIFKQTNSIRTAICALETFKDLSPLQLKFFEHHEFTKQILSFEDTLIKFSENQDENEQDKQKLFLAFEHVSSLLEDSDLREMLSLNKIRTGEELKAKEMQFLQDEKRLDELEGENIGIENVMHRDKKRVDINRLMHLIESNDKNTRTYGLEKLKKALVRSSAIHRNQFRSERNASQAESESSSSIRMIEFDSVTELELLFKALFKSLKNCIKARSQKGVDGDAKSSMSVAGKLIFNGLTSPETDFHSVCSILDILQMILLFPKDNLQSDEEYHIRYTATSSSRVNPLTGKSLTSIQIVFIGVAKEHYRLLFTMSHADEYYHNHGHLEDIHANQDIKCDPGKFWDISEKSAFFFSLAVVYGMKRSHPQGLHASPTSGWFYSALKLEVMSLVKFCVVQTPSYKLYMALTYLAFLSKQIQRQENSGDRRQEVHNSEAGNKIVTALQELLMFNKFALLKSVYWWSIGDRANFLVRRIAMEIISVATSMSSIVAFLWKFDPIPKLLELLTKSFHFKSGEQISFVDNEIKLSNFDESNFTEFEIEFDHLHSDIDSECSEAQANTPNPRTSNQSDVYGKATEKKLPGIVFDLKIIRYILKVLFNLTAYSHSAFTSKNKSQLASYLQELKVGVIRSREYDSSEMTSMPLHQIARYDKLIDFFYSALTAPE